MSQPEKKPYAATRSVAILTVLSVLSPLSGLLMEIMLAWCYGASGTVDAFRVATLLLVLGTQLFLGYVLPHVLVPVFSEYRAKGLEQEGWRLAFSLALILSLASSVFVAWVWFDSGALLGLLAPGLAASGREDAVLLIRCFSLVFLLMVWSGVISGMLNVYRVFWLSAVAQLLPNGFVILAVLGMGRDSGAEALASGILLGYVAMLLLFAYALLRKGREAGISLADCLRPGPREGLLKALYLALPLVATIFIGQWGIIIINRVLSEMPTGTLAEYGYAWKLLALVGLLPAGLATVIFPSFSEAHANGDSTELSRLVMRAVRMTLFLTMPLAAALVVERVPVVYLMFGRGGMSAQAITETGLLFGILLIAAPAGALGAALSKVTFAMHDTKSPTVIALFAALAFTLLVPLAAKEGGANGVAWAYGAICWGSTLLLLGFQMLRYRIMPLGEVLRHSGLLIVLCVGVVFPIMAIRVLFEWYAPMVFGFALLETALAGLIFIVVGYALSRMLGIHESSEIVRYLKWQLQQVPVIRNLKIIGDRDNG